MTVSTYHLIRVAQDIKWMILEVVVPVNALVASNPLDATLSMPTVAGESS